MPLDHLVKQELNPNVMSPREFDLLVNNIERLGMVDALFVTPTGESHADGQPMYRIVGGEHRYDAAEYLGMASAPCTVVDHDDFVADEETFQVVRMNVIHGKLDPQAFFDLYSRLSVRYAEDVLQDAFGFADDAAFRKLIAQTAKTMPTPALQKKFREAAEEIKTIDGLARLLNEMFTRYGSTLPYGYMVVDYGGQRSVWLQISKATMNAVDLLGAACMSRSRTLDDVVGVILQRLARGSEPELLEAVIRQAPEVELPEHMPALPTKDDIEKVRSLNGG